MGFSFTQLVFLTVLVLVVRYIRKHRKPAQTEAPVEKASSQPTTRRVTYVTDREGFLKKIVYEEDTSDVVAGYASRMGKDE